MLWLSRLLGLGTMQAFCMYGALNIWAVFKHLCSPTALQILKILFLFQIKSLGGEYEPNTERWLGSWDEYNVFLHVAGGVEAPP